MIYSRVFFVMIFVVSLNQFLLLLSALLKFPIIANYIVSTADFEGFRTHSHFLSTKGQTNTPVSSSFFFTSLSYTEITSNLDHAFSFFYSLGQNIGCSDQEGDFIYSRYTSISC